MKLKCTIISVILFIYLILFTNLNSFISRIFSMNQGKKYNGTIIAISEIKATSNGKFNSFKYYIPQVELIFNGNKLKVYTSNKGSLNTFKVGEKVKISYTPNSQSKFTIVKNIN